MAIVSSYTNLSFMLLLVLALSLSTSAKYYPNQLKETKMSLYFQDYTPGNPNATVVAVAGIAGKLWSFTQFGIVFVTDDPITETPDPNSATVGRATQGVYVKASLDGLFTHAAFTFMFTNKAYNGSTLELQGNSQQFVPATEVPLVGGTGKFRCARGYATFETIYLNPSIFYAIIRCNVSVLHY